MSLLLFNVNVTVFDVCTQCFRKFNIEYHLEYQPPNSIKPDKIS